MAINSGQQMRNKVTNTSNGNKLSFKVEVVNGKVTNLNTNAWRAHESNREFTQLDGWHAPLNPLKNGYKITGWTKGSNAKGHTWKTLIANPLIRKFDCHWISKGQLKIWWDDHTTPAMLDF